MKFNRRNEKIKDKEKTEILCRFSISGEKEDIIKQIKRLELEKNVEKGLIDIINKECL